MNNSVTAASISPVIRIGISGLPSLANCMVVGGLYILIAELPSARFPMLSGSLAGAINNGVPCTLIVPADPSSFLHRIESFGGIDAAELINADRLQVLVMQDEFRKKMFRFGADSFVEELEQFEIPDNSYLIFDQADELLSLQDISLAMEQVDVLKKWFAAKGITALLVFSRTTDPRKGCRRRRPSRRNPARRGFRRPGKARAVSSRRPQGQNPRPRQWTPQGQASGVPPCPGSSPR